MKMQRRKRKKTDSSLLKRRSVSEKRAGTVYETSRRFFVPPAPFRKGLQVRKRNLYKKTQKIILPS